MGNSGGAPEQNENNLKHGAYRKVFEGFLDDEEKSLLAGISQEPEDVYADELELLTVRERWLLQQIVEIKRENENNRKLMLNSVTKIIGENRYGREDKTVTETTAAFNYLKVLEMELTKVQSSKIKCASELAKLRAERKDAGENAVVDDWVAAVMVDDDE